VRKDPPETTSVAEDGAKLPSRTSAEDVPSKMRKTAVFLIYPEFTALDLIGPHHILSVLGDIDVKLVWKSRGTVTSDTGLSILPNCTFSDCPDEVTVLFVPGGTSGTVAMMSDNEVLEFLSQRGKRAEFVTSVCTGSLVLGAAGLLCGYKATSHWVACEILALLGAEPIAARVVRDRNRITSAGVTAGIDLGLDLAARLAGVESAKAVQLSMEYDPQPPLTAGSPQQAGPETTDYLREVFAPFVKSAREAAEKVRGRW
jgi:cyclohexyl-isocyanide hydratase